MLVLLAVMAFASATIDTACDGFLIERVPEGRRGLGNMVQVGGGYLGMVLGAASSSGSMPDPAGRLRRA
ncbi:hypothetical protein APZ00_25750 (plasmid) [Pannonibacter phragmitetus]|uniref:Uncharacterized protein n=2 Tax=Pannonibacter phragmitetus TaxID=121719 RepID=A0A0U3Q270_9HYPH|nr:hypothetical protein APZ00_25750 [Pannonibacter phragmitetus]